MQVSRPGQIAAAGLLMVGLCGRASAADASVSIAKLLEVGWSISPQARAAADAQFEEVRRLAGDDVRAIEASWLVLMQQRRFEEALKRIDEHIAKQPDDLTALRAKAWVQTVLKNYRAAFVSIDRLSMLLAAQEPKTDADRAVHDESIAFLGRFVGYFGGPAAELVNQDDRKALEKRLLERLPESQRPLLEDARNSVLSKFIEMTDASANARDKAVASVKADKEKTLADLQAEKQGLDAREKELEEQRTRLNSEYKTQMDELARQDQPLVQQQAQLSSRASLLNADLLQTSSRIATLQQLFAGEKDPGRRQQYLSEINTLSLLASRLDADLLGINRLLRGVASQRAAVQARRVQAQSGTAAQVERIEDEVAGLNKRERRNEVNEKRASRPAAATSSKIRALSAQATAFSTYDTLPLEAMKARLLESLR
jgi:predicted  nucleic acid-binding Zn-ribbon protein